jgi:hypothetical protein
MEKTIPLLVILTTSAIIALSSCDKIRKDKGVIAKELNMDVCFDPENANNEWVIRTQAQYDSLFATTTCTSAQETIDFNTYTLLGKYAYGGARTKFFRQVLREDDHQMIHYNILVKSHGSNGKKMSYNYNWVLVPKFPDNYTVEFNVKKK